MTFDNSPQIRSVWDDFTANFLRAISIISVIIMPQIACENLNDTRRDTRTWQVA